MANDLTKPCLLAFDTAGPYCAAALMVNGKVGATCVEEMTRGQAERLMGLLETTLAEAGLTWQALDAIGVGVGPGNFTGIRIAVAAARGLALGLGKPAIGVSGFEARRFGTASPVSVLIPAPRNQFYRQDFGADSGSEPLLQDDVAARADLAANDLPIAPEPSVDILVRNIACFAASRLGQDMPPPAPLYIRPADAAPSSTPAPILLDV